MLNINSLNDLMIWLTGVGSPIVVGYLLSFLAERWKKWHTLPYEIKFITPMIVSVILTLCATWLLAHPEIIQQYDPTFKIVIGSIIIYLTTQKSYKDNKADVTEG